MTHHLKLLQHAGGSSFKRQLAEVRQIELTSRCNLKCVYCPNPTMGGPERRKLDMTLDVFAAALDWVRFFVKQGTQTELNLAGIGESTLHPGLLLFAEKARAAIGPRRMLFLTTNGVAFTEEHARVLAELGAKVGVSAHRPEKATAAMLLCKKYGIFHSISNDPMQSSVNWAGQVDWPVQVPHRKYECDWFRNGMAFIMADGRVSHCCFDATGAGVVANVMTARPDEVSIMPSALCRGCHLAIDGPEDFNQDTAFNLGER